MSDRPQEGRDRRTGIIVGNLFIVATAFLFLGEPFYKPFLVAPDALTVVAQNKPRFLLGLGIELICILAMPLIGAFIFPVLSRVSTGMALAYFFFRSLEGIVLLAVALTNKLAVLTLSEAMLAGGDPAASDAALTVIRAQNAWADTASPLYNVIFVCGALCLYSVLYRARLVPRWISVWGLVSVLVLGGAVISAIFVKLPLVWEVGLVAPLAVQEMVMALWFIFRGFDLDRVTADHPRAAGGAQ